MATQFSSFLDNENVTMNAGMLVFPLLFGLSLSVVKCKFFALPYKLTFGFYDIRKSFS